MSIHATLFQGMITGDNKKFVRGWAEVSVRDFQTDLTDIDDFQVSNGKWVPYNKGGGARKWYGNHDLAVNFGEEGRDFTRGKRQFSNFFFKTNFSWSYISSTRDPDTRIYPSGFIWDVAGSSLFPKEIQHLEYFSALVGSAVGGTILNILNPTINVQVENIAAIPVIFGSDTVLERIRNLVSGNVLISKSDWNAHEVSWDFRYNALLAKSNSVKSDFFIWRQSVEKEFYLLHSNEEELNRLFIDIYGLQDELTPEVPLKDITILQEELDSDDLRALEDEFRAGGGKPIELPIKRDVVMQQFLSYCVGLMMGRYRLDEPGLHIAHPEPTAEEVASYSYNGHTVEIDDDAILPLMGSACQFPDDVLHRVYGLLDVIWGEETRTANVNFLEECLGKSLEKYLVKDFFKDHCKRYKKKPIYWLFSSPKGAFQVLAYMHRMNAFTVEKIRSNYLLEHLRHLRQEEQMLASNEASLSSRDAKRLDQLRKDIAECEAYDLDLKDVADRQIAFDLDDGVTENHKLFGNVVAKIK
jgi:hypothetical protein